MELVVYRVFFREPALVNRNKEHNIVLNIVPWVGPLLEAVRIITSSYEFLKPFDYWEDL